LEYNTLNYQKDSARIQHSGQGILPVVPFEFSGNDVHGSAAGQPASTYSVYVAGTGFSEFDNSIGGTSQPSRKWWHNPFIWLAETIWWTIEH